MRTVEQKPKDPIVVKLSRKEIWFRQGMVSYERGDPMPPNHWPDDQWNGPVNEGQCFWLGYMLARARVIMLKSRRQDAVREYIEDGVDLPPDFR